MDFDLDHQYDPDASISYEEACKHAEANYRRTNGMVVGGGYNVRFPSGDVRLVDLRIGALGIARPVYDD